MNAATPQAPMLSVVVLSWNTRALTLACLRALAGDSPRHRREVIVVDNGSGDGSADAVAAAFPDVVLLRNAENRGYAAGNNQGAAVARGRFLCTLNSDTEVRPGALDRLVDFLLDHPDHGAVAPKLVEPDGSVQRACMRFPGFGVILTYDTVLARVPPGRWIDDRYHMRDFDHLSERDVDQPPGACFVIDRAEFLALGGLDEELWLFFNDVDLCRRLWRRGRRIRYLPAAEVLHHRGASTARFDRRAVLWFRNRIAYHRKHHGRPAVWLLRLVLRWRALEESWRAGRRHAAAADVRAERAAIRDIVRQVLLPAAGEDTP